MKRRGNVTCARSCNKKTPKLGLKSGSDPRTHDLSTALRRLREQQRQGIYHPPSPPTPAPRPKTIHKHSYSY